MTETTLVPLAELTLERQLGPAEQLRSLVDLWLAQVAPTSRRSYLTSIADFAAHLGLKLEPAVLQLLKDRGRAHALGMSYRAHLLESKKAPNTLNLRISALRSLVHFARGLGLVDWSLTVRGVKAERFKDTRGPGKDGFRALLKSAKTPRDKAILWLLYGCALRRGEVAGLDLEHVQGDVVQVQGKGSRDRVPVTIPPPVKRSLEAWVLVRGQEPGPLFLNRYKGRLSAWSLNDLLVRLGKRSKLGHVRPHGLRHAAITEALDLSDGNVRAVQRFSRHKDVRMLQVYDDNREDLGGAMAALVAGAADL